MKAVGMKTVAERKLKQLREQYFPDSEARIWRAEAEKGYCCVPRSLPLMRVLLCDKAIVGSANCDGVYLDLLSRSKESGIVEIANEDTHAYFAGYTGSRARRSWRERIFALRDSGFIEIAPRANQEIGFVLLVHPHVAVSALRQKKKIDDEWWSEYERLQREVSATAPELPVSRPKKKASG